MTRGADVALPLAMKASKHRRLTRLGSVRQAVAENPNVCKQLHMPAQSGSTTVLARMRRGYTRDAYDALLQHVYEHLPQVCSCFTRDRRAGGCLE